VQGILDLPVILKWELSLAFLVLLWSLWSLGRAGEWGRRLRRAHTSHVNVIPLGAHVRARRGPRRARTVLLALGLATVAASFAYALPTPIRMAAHPDEARSPAEPGAAVPQPAARSGESAHSASAPAPERRDPRLDAGAPRAPAAVVRGGLGLEAQYPPPAAPEQASSAGAAAGPSVGTPEPTPTATPSPTPSVTPSPAPTPTPTAPAPEL
jgi:hypothetical protein